MEPAFEVTRDRKSRRKHEMTATDPNKEATASRGKAFFPFLVLGIGIALSILLHFVIKDNVKGEAKLRFERQASDAQHNIAARVRSYFDVMYGLGALYSTSNSISRSEFHRYVSGLDLPHRYPGFQIINYAEYVPAESKPKFEEARDSGQLTTSGRLLRIQGSERYVALTMRLSVYRLGLPLNTVEQRRAAYIGSIGSGFRVKELMQGVLNESTLRYMRFQLYDAGPVQSEPSAATVRSDQLLFDSDSLLEISPSQVKAEDPEAFFTTKLPIEVGGRIWEIRFSARKAAIIDRTDALLPWLTLAAGLASSMLLFLVLYSLASSRRRALQIAEVITKDLRESEASLAQAQHMARLGNWSLDLANGTMEWSAETYRIFGFNPAFPPPPYEDFLRRIHVKDRASFNEALQETLRASQDCKIEHRITLKDGITRWVHTIAQPAQNAQQAVVRGTIMDITESKLAALRLQVEHRVAQLVASTEDPDQAMPQIIETICTGFGWECGSHWSLDKDGALLRCSTSWGEKTPAIWEFLALTKKMSAPNGVDLPGRAWANRELLFVKDVASEQGFSRTAAAQQAGLRGALALPIMAGGRVFGVIELLSAEPVQPDEALSQLLKSISAQIGQCLQRRLAEDQLRFIATHDPLTELPNRAMFNERLRHALHQGVRYNRGLAVMFIDIDRFKVVNDSLGHGAGDRLLQNCAKRLTKS